MPEQEASTDEKLNLRDAVELALSDYGDVRAVVVTSDGWVPIKREGTAELAKNLLERKMELTDDE